ncbi:hypothetical protein Sjap_008824 [Stephania japonica]|uniref:Uncharacterized protein n=1 Tax=Stephania japonica TaxID=461633 RepID=A0AAP0JR58_9MAGN
MHAENLCNAWCPSLRVVWHPLHAVHACVVSTWEQHVWTHVGDVRYGDHSGSCHPNASVHVVFLRSQAIVEREKCKDMLTEQIVDLKSEMEVELADLRALAKDAEDRGYERACRDIKECGANEHCVKMPNKYIGEEEDGHGIGELEHPNHIRGHLISCNMEKKRSVMDAKKAKLDMKKQISHIA